MITEPEMGDGSGTGWPTDVLSNGGRPPRRRWWGGSADAPAGAPAGNPADGPSDDPAGGPASRWGGLSAAQQLPWAWALGGIVTASAVWVAVLLSTGYGRTPAPDLHGYHVGRNPCGGGTTLQPLTDALNVPDLFPGVATVTRGPAVDQVDCTLIGQTIRDDWATTYTITVGAELHKKTDPRPEFENTYQVQVSSITPTEPGTSILTVGFNDVSKPYPGLGDSAYLTTSRTRQALDVLYGGATISLSVEASVQWAGTGTAPVSTDNSPQFPTIPTTYSLRTTLPSTMRHLMTFLATQPPTSP